MKRIVVLALMMVLAVSASADWYPEDPAKWVQFPDLDPTGIDVNTSFPYFLLADDFECTMTGPITDIHIWGSWYHDYLPGGFDPYGVTFTLSIHEDIPAGVGGIDYSRPGEVLWIRQFHGPAGEFVPLIWAEDINEGWMEPPDFYEFPGDHVCWQYNFFIDEAEAFIQQGEPGAPVIYWLDVQAEPLDGEAWFGWKTSLDHWNDDAVWGYGPEPYIGPWFELIYPPQHDMAGLSIDLAFVITTLEEEPLDDWGDAPDPTYPTLAASIGASHVVVPGVQMGPSIDPEPDGQPDPNALGDDNDGNDDEDGVIFPAALIPGTNALITVDTSVGGFVDMWIDWELDGSWAGNQVLAGVPVTGGPIVHSVPVPVGVGSGLTFARVRFNTVGPLGVGGPAMDGEVEDYEVFLGEEIEEDWGDAPDPTYPTWAVNGGASHIIVQGIMMGASIDSEPDGQPDPNALGDDNDGNDDEDGVNFTTPLLPGMGASVDIITSTGGFVDMWIDWEADGSWLGNKVLNGVPVPAGLTPHNFTVPFSAMPGVTFARIRFNTVGPLGYTGQAPDGEVEDYEVVIEEGETYKWLQPPDLDITGIDVNATFPYILADDWLCTEPGRVDEIHIWGSWRNDYLPNGFDPHAVHFTLSIHEDIPADSLTGEYSRPGEMLWMWSYPEGDYIAEIWQDQIEEGWMDPPASYIFPGDWTCWHYVFFVPPEAAFHQIGTPDEPIVYWLDLQAEPLDPEAYFGWKTSYEHWNDDAVYGTGPEPYPGPWSELIYPNGHQWEFQSIDLAFALRSNYGTGVDDHQIPERSGLYQNVPNPFNPKTTIQYDVPAGGCHVAIDIYDASGRLVRHLVDEVKTEGTKEVTWDGRDNDGRALSSGVYFYRLSTPESRVTKKMMLLK